jgi:hypothetical protein
VPDRHSEAVDVAKFSSKDLTFTVGGTAMQNYLLRIGNVKVKAILAESHAFGDTWFEAISTGIKQMEPLTVGGFYDDAATTGPDAVFSPIGTTVAIVITWGGSKTTSFSAIIEDYDRKPNRGGMTEWDSVLRPTGTVTEA